jgi:fructokinase
VVTAVGIREVPVPTVEVVDTVGAGDAFGAATLTAWLESGRGRSDLERVDADGLAAMATAARFGAQVSAVTCTRSGADPPRRAELGELSA